MKTIFVSRHQGAIDWVKSQPFHIDQYTHHLCGSDIHEPVIVLGTLPIHVAAIITASGGRYLHLKIETPPEKRGQELTSQDLTRYNASFIEFNIQKIGSII